MGKYEFSNGNVLVFKLYYLTLRKLWYFLAIGKPLTSGLNELIKRRPSKPTLYLAEHLTNHFDDLQSDQESEVSLAKLV